MEAKKLMSSFQLMGSRVIKFNLSNDFIGLESVRPDKCDVSYSVKEIEKDDEVIMGVIQLDVKASIKGKGKAKNSCSLSMEGGFCAPVEMPEESFITMLEINGTASLYSLARAFIANTTSLATTSGHIVLPMINTIQLVEAQKQEVSDKQ